MAVGARATRSLVSSCRIIAFSLSRAGLLVANETPSLRAPLALRSPTRWLYGSIFECRSRRCKRNERPLVATSSANLLRMRSRL